MGDIKDANHNANYLKLEEQLAAALIEIQRLTLENTKLRHIVSVYNERQPVSVGRKRPLETQSRDTRKDRRFKPITSTSELFVTPNPFHTPDIAIDTVDSNATTLGCSRGSNKTPESTDCPKASMSKANIQKKIDKQKKVMHHIIKEFSENCRPRYKDHLNIERKKIQSHTGDRQTGKVKLLR